MNNSSQLTDQVISEYELAPGFDYNFDLTPFRYIIEGIYHAVAIPSSLVTGLYRIVSARLHKIQEDQAFRRTFKGPACILK